MEDKIVQIAYEVLAILIPALVALVAELVRRRLGTERIQKIQEELVAKQELAIIAVKFVEQAYMQLKGPEKYQQAAAWLAKQAQNHGIKLAEDEIKGLVEWALREIKDELGEQWADGLQS
ncbi:phage holin [Peptococcaceae bacterium 1198_IL3148]